MSIHGASVRDHWRTPSRVARPDRPGRIWRAGGFRRALGVVGAAGLRPGIMGVVTAGAEPQVRLLELRMGIPDVGGPPDVYPVLTILIDGDELLAAAGSGYVASPPAALLDDDEPLLPADPPRRVVLYTDTCGVPVAGSLAPVISASGGLVVWSDFAHFMDMDDAPVINEGQDGLLSRHPVGVPDLVFDAAQYTAEVRRASVAREWESDRWRTALLADEYLSPDRWWNLAGSGWDLGWIEPAGEDGSQFSVTCWDENLEHGLVLTLTISAGTPEDRARRIADYLLSTPAEQWPVASRIHRGGSPCKTATGAES